MADDRALVPHKGTLTPRKLVPRYRSFTLLATDEPLLAQLPGPQREILQAQGSYEELSQRLNLPAGTVRSRLHRARAALTKLRAAEHPDEAPDRETAH